MKLLTILALCLSLTSCVTDPATGKRTVNWPLVEVTAGKLAGIALQAAAEHYGVDPTSAQAINSAVAELSGIAAQSQANLGATPKAANVAQGSSIVEVGLAVQKALGNQPLSQPVVDALFQAAAVAQQP